MERKAASGIMLTLLLLNMLTLAFNIQAVKAEPGTIVVPDNYPTIQEATESPTPLIGDALIAPDLPTAHNSSVTPGYYETSEYLIGSVAVGVVFLESNGTIDPSTEDWTSTRESQVINKIQSGLSWLANYYPNANISFVYNIHYRVPTNYEPINHPHTDQGLWIAEAMNYLGHPGSYYFTQVRDFINSLRDSLKTKWVFAIFVVDSWNDPDGCFTDQIDPTRKWSAYAYLGGPFLVMTYDNDGYGINNMNYVTAHETCHIFYATDEYDGRAEISGYLGVQDLEGSGCMMEKANTWWLCTNSKQQLGWRDSDADRIQDIVDIFPNTVLNPYWPDPTTTPTLTYTGTVTEIPYPNNNPYGTGRDITINTITNVEFRVDNGTWQGTTPDDGAFDEDVESFSFTTQSLPPGTHTIETRGINSVGNAETSYARDEVTVSIPDVAVTSVTPFKTVVGQGYSLNINVTAANQGDYTETFNVTVYANTTSIATQTITLTSGNSTTITLTWNTTGFVPGNYTISAYATPLPSETNTADNTYTDGTVQILQTHALTITTTVGGTTDPASGTYSYTANSTVYATAIPEANYLLDHWELDSVNVGSANPYTVLMDKAHTLKAVFSPVPPPLSVSISPLLASINLGQPLTLTSTVTGGTSPYTYQWYVNLQPIETGPWNFTFTPTTSGIYYIHLKVTDARGSTAQSETARVTVAAVPVGGYSIPIKGQNTPNPLTLYLALIAILATVFTATRRKIPNKK